MSGVMELQVDNESLSQAFDRVHRRLLAVGGQSASPEACVARPAEERPAEVLARLRDMFDLSPFERDVVVLCAGAALEPRFLSACAAVHGNAQATWPTFGLALAVLEGAHWSATSRSRPLRYWSLVDLSGRADGQTDLMHTVLRIDERILHYLLGVDTIDEQLDALVRPLRADADDAPNPGGTLWTSRLEEGLRHWSDDSGRNKPLLLCGASSAGRESAFVELCARAGLHPYLLNTADLPAPADQRKSVARLWTREAALHHAALYIRSNDAEPLHNLSAWLDVVHAPIAIDVPAGSGVEQLPGLRLDVPRLSAAERKAAWVDRLGDAAKNLNGRLDRIVDYFHFDQSMIEAAAATALKTPLTAGVDIGDVAWRTCRVHGRRSLDNLARRIEPRATWSELVLPEAQTETLRQIAIHMRQRAVVNLQWGFFERYSRGHGLSALFAGGSGTGKTMAAEIIARDLDLDLYHIDLASMVSKYIGETEKNLRRVFDAAEESGCVLLFDECDALFGKRSEVRDSHDRYANLEVSYLLQRMDSYRGVAILTTNMRHALDSAFLRRIRFIVQFPFPDAASRSRIWQGIFPDMAPLDKVDFEQLAQLNVSGGVIRNIATHAAFLAAEAQARIGPQHILAAARIEYTKLERPLTAAEMRGWS
jgi:hypothetical protein